MNISMNPSARYVTLQGFYSGNVVGKPLTDRRIAYWQKRGKYGEYKPIAKQSKRQNVLANLLKDFAV